MASQPSETASCASEDRRHKENENLYQMPAFRRCQKSCLKIYVSVCQFRRIQSNLLFQNYSPILIVLRPEIPIWNVPEFVLPYTL